MATAAATETDGGGGRGSSGCPGGFRLDLAHVDEVGDEDGAPGAVSGSEEAIGDGYTDDASMAEIKKEGDLRREAEGDGGEQN